MKQIVVGIVLLAVGFGVGYFVASPQVAEHEPSVGENEQHESFTASGEKWTRYTVADLGIQFTYRVEPHGYVLDTRFATEPDEAGFERNYIVMLEEDFLELQASEGAREGPPTINIAVFRNSENLFPRLWADRYPAYSGIERALTDVGDVVVAGANAIRYRADGLYMTDTIILANGEHIFLVTGAFLDEDSRIRKDFEPFVNSLSFVQVEE